MDFTLDEELEEVRALAHEIFTDRATTDRVRVAESSETHLDEALWSELGKAGLLGIAAPEEAGGAGLGLAALCVLLEEQGRFVAPVPLWPAAVAALAIAGHGTPAQRASLLPGAVDGTSRLTVALEEFGPADPADPACTARRDASGRGASGRDGSGRGGDVRDGDGRGGSGRGGDARDGDGRGGDARDGDARDGGGVPDGGGWRLTGTKAVVPSPFGASHVLVSAATEEGPGLFLVDSGAEGVAWERVETTTHDLAGNLTLTGAPAQAVGPPGGGAVTWTVERAAVALAALQLGVAQGALRHAVTYLAERRQFGRPLATFQAVQHQLADCYIDIDAMRVCLWQAVTTLAEGSATADVLVAKWWAGDAGLTVAHRVQHVHGGIGVDVDYPVHRHFLWARQIAGTLGGPSADLARLGAVLAAGPVAR
ncbi:acyl-CoA dehydrogenase family protein [Nonomuraea sp. NPDC048916]|uniref:acyl-CoA dehydrogenase family protein n=1 Tax=Nonomuraea sp. NPDC048916 TaxID=3154232 RepID=UPI0033ED0985